MENVPVNVNSQAHTERGSDNRLNDLRHHGKIKKNRLKFVSIIVGIVILVAIIVLAGWFIYGSSTGSNIEGDKYQAVFLTDGQVYFGKLHTLNSEYMKLTNIYYLQTKATPTSNPQQTTSQAATNVQLVKLGNEIHGPEDEMIISKRQIMFFENLKNTGKVSTLIEQENKK
jgi:hypothetical protein